MFDAVSYMKGGRILNMLRNYVGEAAFYKSLNLFLTNYKFKAAEAQELRLAFEEVTGTGFKLVLEPVVLWKWPSKARY